MRVAEPTNFPEGKLIETFKITEVPPNSREIFLITKKDKEKAIKKVERIVRNSPEYRNYIAYLKEHLDMKRCSFFSNIYLDRNKKSKVKIEMHHEPFTLFDICAIVLEKHIKTEPAIRLHLVAKEVVMLHYQNRVGLIPLAKTVHDLVGNGKLFIPLQSVKGKFMKFFEEYEQYIESDPAAEDEADIVLKLQEKFELSKQYETEKVDMSILNRRFVYLEVDGMNMPKLIETPETAVK